jgi:predicted ATPase/class 3 adenylate cyclase
VAEREQLEQAIAHMEAQRAVLGDAVVDVTLATLREKLAALEAHAALEQRKQVTVLFADVAGFTAMVESMDAEDVHDTMNALWTRLDGAITAEGGTVDKHIGDAVMALFGAPTAHEDDPERAIRAALAMQAELAAFREAQRAALAMRIGVHTGPVLLGLVGTTAEYTAMGDAVNLASRLEHAAPVGAILISRDTYRHVRGVFDVQPLAPIRVKGKREPVHAYVVQGTRPRPFRVATRGIEGIETHMIGRDAELRRLQDALYDVMEEGEGRAITIFGEAGAGKSRLLYEFNNWIERLPETVVCFKGRAGQQTSNLPYALIRDLFARHFQIRDSDPAAVARDKLEQGVVACLGPEGAEKAPFIGQLVGFDFSDSPYLRGIVGDARQIRGRAFHYMAQFFATAASRPASVSPGGETSGGAVLFLEDIHWADDGSLDLVDHLVRGCRQVPLLIVGLARPELFERRPLWGEGQEAHTRLELRPLSKRDSRRLVEEILQKVEEVPPTLRDLVVREAEGNPFYVEELVKVLIEDGVIAKGPGRWRVKTGRLADVRVPPTLTGVLQARLDRLPVVERETLQRASVVGRVFWDSAVERVGERAPGRTGGARVQAALQALRGRELIFEREASAFAGARECIFKHAVLRDVTYESVLKRLRPTYHAQMAAWLIEHSGERVGEYAGLIGEHHERAGERAQAAEWYGQAGRQAQETYALETASGYFQKALALGERWEWRKRQVEVLHILGRRDEEEAGLRALEAAPEAPVSQVPYLWGQYHEAIGDYARAQTAVARALAASRGTGSVVGEVRCLDRLGFIAWRQGRYDQAKAWYEQAMALLGDKDAYSDEEAQALAQVLNGLGTVHRQQGQFDEAWACYERALALNRMTGNRAGEARALNNLGVTAYYRRHFGEALTHHEQALEIRRAIGDRAGEGESLNNLAMTVRQMGDYGQVKRYLLAALTIQQATGNRWEEGNIWNELGVMYQEMGDLSTARTCLRRGLKLSQDIGDEAGEAYILANLGLVMRNLGDMDTAERFLTEGLALAQAQDDKRLVAYFLSHLGVVHLRAGRLDQAIDRADAALAMRREINLVLWTTADLTTLAAAHLAAGDVAQALNYAQQALAILEECGGEGPEFPQRDYYICHQVLSAAGQEDAARAALQSAYDQVLARADRITAPALRQSFLEQVPINREIIQEYENHNA